MTTSLVFVVKTFLLTLHLAVTITLSTLCSALCSTKETLQVFVRGLRGYFGPHACEYTWGGFELKEKNILKGFTPSCSTVLEQDVCRKIPGRVWGWNQNVLLSFSSLFHRFRQK